MLAKTAKWSLIHWVIAAAVMPAVLGWWGCASVVPPGSFRAVKEPRAGRAIGSRVAVVYSKHYQINLGGLEKLHPFDINKYARIYLAMNTEGLIEPRDVYVPKPVTEEDIRLVHSQAFVDRLGDSEAVAGWLEFPALGMAPAALIDVGVLNAFRAASGGTILAGREAVKHG
jgi:histone deacetylase 11